MSLDQPASSYLQHLPAIFHEDPFAGRFLLAFETILGDAEAAGQPGLERTIGGLAAYLRPADTPEEFLPWLANWVALTLRSDWTTETKRAFLQIVVLLYRHRGTLFGLEKLLGIYTQRPVIIDDAFDDLPHYFQVVLQLDDARPGPVRRMQQIARAIIDQEKPAHTYYGLRVSIPTMRLVSLELQAREEREGLAKPPLLMLGDNTVLGSRTGP